MKIKLVSRKIEENKSKKEEREEKEGKREREVEGNSE